MVRRHRMLGFDCAWVPGLDHAGIATQAVVERRLEPGARLVMGREAFEAEVWRWKAVKERDIVQQLRRLGLAMDWDRLTFTLDPPYAEAVTELFCRLHERGLIFRQARGVNWCPALQSVISDIEVEVRDVQGTLHVVDYGHGVTVATTRPETIYADVAVAVHPSDPRFAGITRCVNPLTGRELPVIRDAVLVDPTLGTGAVKVTPAHSFEDRACADRVGGLPIDVTAFDERGVMGVGTHVAGQDRLAARDAVVAVLRAKGAYVRGERHALRVPTCSRSGDVLEPSWRPQWFVDCKRMSQRALSYTDAIIPEKHRGEWRKFLSEERDWCVSRQLWWGHRVPAYLVDGEWVVSRTPPPRFEAQDEDVLDTWFSSALFPLASLGWPKRLDRRRYPLSIMETGSDILFFWVARMAMICSEMEPELGCPFGRVALHPMVRDRFGRKMSKSVGNVIDPIALIEGQSLADMVAAARANPSRLSAAELERSLVFLQQEFPEGLPRCGADAVRFTLIDQEAGDALNLDVASVVETTHMCNKIWNAWRFVSARPAAAAVDPLQEGPAERWLRAQLALLSNHMLAGFESDRLHRCTRELRTFLGLFCNHYLEHVKVADSDVARALARFALEAFLLHLHPFMPFLTEHLLGPDCGQRSVPDAVAAVDVDGDVEPYQHVIDLVTTVRGLRARRKQPFEVHVLPCGEAVVDATLLDCLPLVRRLCRVDAIAAAEVSPSGALIVSVRRALRVAVTPAEDGAAAAASSAAKVARLELKLARIDATFQSERASPAVQEKQRRVREELMAQIAALKGA